MMLISMGNTVLMQFESSALLAAGFLNPLLAGGFGLVALPILIHLLSRRRFRRLDWAATRFLLEAERENRRRVRFEQWLLLALRCLAMALLAAVISRPFVRPGLVASLLGSSGQSARIIIIDDSASLGLRVGGGNEFETVKSAATRLVQWLSQEAAGDPVSLWLTSNRTEPLVEETRLDRGRVRDIVAQIERVNVSNMRARPAGLVTNLAQRLAATKELSSADVYVISDFQKTDWIGSGENGRSCFDPLAQMNASAGSQDAAKSPMNVRVVLIAAGESTPPNTALLNVDIDRPQIIAGLPTILNATVAEYSGTSTSIGANRDTVVQVEVDGAAQPPVAVEDLGTSGQKSISMELTIADPGFREITVRLSPGDGFPADDVRRLAVRAKDTIPVLIVNGQPAIESYADEVHLLRNALAPPGTFSSGLRVEVIDASELDGTPLNGFDCVFLCNVARPSDGAIAALTRFVRDGGGLGVFLGSEIADLGDFNRALFADGAGLLPVALREVETAPDRGVGMVRVGEHPVTSAFSPSAESISEYVRFRSYFRVSELAADEGADGGGAADGATSRPATRVLARYTDADQSPALIEKILGRGHVLLFTSSADLEWNDWGRAPDGSYVVTMLEMASYLARRDEHPRQFTVGEPLVVQLSPDEYQSNATLKSPAYPEDPAEELTLNNVGDLSELRSRPATRLGMYRLEVQPRNALPESWPLAVNLDRDESDLTRASEEELDAALVGIPHSRVEAEAGFLNSGSETRRELWPAALMLLALVLVSEQALAWWFGKVEHSGINLRRAANRDTDAFV